MGFGYLLVASHNKSNKSYSLKVGTTSVGNTISSDIRIKIKNALPATFFAIHVQENALALLEKKYGNVLLNNKKITKQVYLKHEDSIQIENETISYHNDSLKIKTSENLSIIKKETRCSALPTLNSEMKPKTASLPAGGLQKRRRSLILPSVSNKTVPANKSSSVIPKEKYRKVTSESISLRKSLFLNKQLSEDDIMVKPSTSEVNDGPKTPVKSNKRTSARISSVKSAKKMKTTEEGTPKIVENEEKPVDTTLEASLNIFDDEEEVANITPIASPKIVENEEETVDAILETSPKNVQNKKELDYSLKTPITPNKRTSINNSSVSSTKELKTTTEETTKFVENEEEAVDTTVEASLKIVGNEKEIVSTTSIASPKIVENEVDAVDATLETSLEKEEVDDSLKTPIKALKRTSARISSVKSTKKMNLTLEETPKIVENEEAVDATLETLPENVQNKEEVDDSLKTPIKALKRTSARIFSVKSTKKNNLTLEETPKIVENEVEAVDATPEKSPENVQNKEEVDDSLKTPIKANKRTSARISSVKSMKKIKTTLEETPKIVENEEEAVDATPEAAPQIAENQVVAAVDSTPEAISTIVENQEQIADTTPQPTRRKFQVRGCSTGNVQSKKVSLKHRRHSLRKTAINLSVSTLKNAKEELNDTSVTTLDSFALTDSINELSQTSINSLDLFETPVHTKIVSANVSMKNDKHIDEFTTPPCPKSPLNDLTNVDVEKQSSETENMQTSPESDLTDKKGAKKLLETLKREQKSPKNDLTNVQGVKQLLRSAKKTPKTPKNDLVNIPTIKQLFVKQTPLNDLSDVRGVKTLLRTTRKRERSPINDLTNVPGIKKLFVEERKVEKSPLNDLSDLRGVKQLLGSPKDLPKSPKNDLSKVDGVKKLFAEKKVQKSPRNDLTNVAGVKKLFAEERKVQKSPTNDLTDVRGVKQLLGSPKSLPKSPKNDLTNVDGVKDIFAEEKSPRNSLDDVEGVPELFESPIKPHTSAENEIVNVEPSLESVENDKEITIEKIQDHQISSSTEVTPESKNANELLNNDEENAFDQLINDQEEDLTLVRSKTPKVYHPIKKGKTPENNLMNISSLAELFQTPKLSDSLLGDKSKRGRPKLTSKVQSSAEKINESSTKKSTEGKRLYNDEMSMNATNDDESVAENPVEKIIRSSKKKINHVAECTPVKRSRRLQLKNESQQLEESANESVKQEEKPKRAAARNRKAAKQVEEASEDVKEELATSIEPKAKRTRQKKVKEPVEEAEKTPIKTTRRKGKQNTSVKDQKSEETEKVDEKPKRTRGKKAKAEESVAETPKTIVEDQSNEQTENVKEKPKRARGKKANAQENVAEAPETSAKDESNEKTEKVVEKPKRAKGKKANAAQENVAEVPETSAKDESNEETEKVVEKPKRVRGNAAKVQDTVAEASEDKPKRARGKKALEQEKVPEAVEEKPKRTNRRKLTDDEPVPAPIKRGRKKAIENLTEEEKPEDEPVGRVTRSRRNVKN